MSKSQMKKMQKAAAAAAASGKMPMEPDDMMPSMPILPDPNVKYFWTGSNDTDVKDIDYLKYIQVWPSYIDSNKKIPDGRRISLEFCCPDPNVGEISEVCQSLKLKHVLEPFKMYPRDFGTLGRVRVQLHNEDGTLCHPEIKTKKDLLKKFGELIPLLKSRIRRLEEEKQASLIQQQSQIQAQPQANPSSSSGNNAKKKKGKKGPK